MTEKEFVYTNLIKLMQPQIKIKLQHVSKLDSYFDFSIRNTKYVTTQRVS